MGCCDPLLRDVFVARCLCCHLEDCTSACSVSEFHVPHNLSCAHITTCQHTIDNQTTSHTASHHHTTPAHDRWHSHEVWEVCILHPTVDSVSPVSLACFRDHRPPCHSHVWPLEDKKRHGGVPSTNRVSDRNPEANTTVPKMRSTLRSVYPRWWVVSLVGLLPVLQWTGLFMVGLALVANEPCVLSQRCTTPDFRQG